MCSPYALTRTDMVSIPLEYGLVMCLLMDAPKTMGDGGIGIVFSGNGAEDVL